MPLGKPFKKLVGALAVLVVMAGCTPPGDDETPDDEPGATGSPTITTGGTLMIGRTGDIDQLDPHLATAFQTIDALELVYDTLFELDPELNVQPGLATGWEYSPDGTELTITLREGVTFHDGDPFTSADVVTSLERILDESTGAVGRSFLLSIEEISAPDDLTVVLGLPWPTPPCPAR